MWKSLLIKILRSWWSAVCSCSSKCKVFMSRVAVCTEIFWEGVQSGLPPVSWCLTDAKQVLWCVLFQYFPKNIYDMISPYILSIVVYILWSNVVLQALTAVSGRKQLKGSSVFLAWGCTQFLLFYMIFQESKGYEFESETDTETIPKLIKYMYDNRESEDTSFSALVERVIQQLVSGKLLFLFLYNTIRYLWGSLAFCLMHLDPLQEFLEDGANNTFRLLNNA